MTEGCQNPMEMEAPQSYIQKEKTKKEKGEIHGTSLDAPDRSSCWTLGIDSQTSHEH